MEKIILGGGREGDADQVGGETRSEEKQVHITNDHRTRKESHILVTNLVFTLSEF